METMDTVMNKMDKTLAPVEYRENSMNKYNIWYKKDWYFLTEEYSWEGVQCVRLGETILLKKDGQALARTSCGHLPGLQENWVTAVGRKQLH